MRRPKINQEGNTREKLKENPNQRTDYSLDYHQRVNRKQRNMCTFGVRARSRVMTLTIK